MKSIKEVIDKMITSIPNKIYKHNAGGIQLIKLEEMKTIWPPSGWTCHGPESVRAQAVHPSGSHPSWAPAQSAHMCA